MKIIIDENMPYAQQLFCQFGQVVAVPGRPLPRDVLKDADALMIRSVTPVDQALLDGSALKFVGTATAGTDHVDIAALDAAGVAFSAAPGCNAIAVVEYVLSALLTLAERDGFQLSERTVGIVGVGNVGARLQQRCEALGIKTLLCDPPRARRHERDDFRDFETVVAEADILTFHTPLIRGGQDNSWHLVDKSVLEALKPQTILINACRGEVVDNQALLEILAQRDDLTVVLDVWEPEPDLNPELFAKVDLASAHIAGYTLEGKARGTTQLFEAWSAFIGQPQQVSLEALLPPPAIRQVSVSGEYHQGLLKRLAHLVYDIRVDDALLRQTALAAGEFDRLRKHYQPRREWSSLEVLCDVPETAEQLAQLGFKTRVTETTR